MQTVNLRRRLCLLGFTMEEKGSLFLVSNNGAGKNSVEHEFKSLSDVETWTTMLEGKKKED